MFEYFFWLYGLVVDWYKSLLKIFLRIFFFCNLGLWIFGMGIELVKMLFVVYGSSGDEESDEEL